MASYAHSMTSGSLPSDYATVSRYAAAHSNGVEQGEESADAEHTPGESRIARRPSRPSMAASPFLQHPHLTLHPTENTPLLASDPHVPRIVERDDKNQSDAGLSTTAIYLAELRILTKYS